MKSCCQNRQQVSLCLNHPVTPAGALRFGLEDAAPLVTFPYSRATNGTTTRTFAIRQGLDFDRMVAAVAGTEGSGSLPGSPTHSSRGSHPGGSSQPEAEGPEGAERAQLLSLIRSVSKRHSFNLGNLPIPLEEGTFYGLYAVMQLFKLLVHP